MKIHPVKGRLVNSYVIEDGNDLLIIDVAWRGEKYVLGFIREVLKRSLHDVKLITYTHSDPDHNGGVANVAATCNAQIAAPYASQSARLKLAHDPTGYLFKLTTALLEGLRPRAWLMYANPRKDAHARTLPSHIPELNTSKKTESSRKKAAFEQPLRLRNNDVLPGFTNWQVIHTPGHSWDSNCYYHKPSETLISGDTLLGSNKKGGLVKPAVFSNPLQLRRTIKKLKQLNPKAVYPGHGPHFHGSNLLEHL